MRADSLDTQLLFTTARLEVETLERPRVGTASIVRHHWGEGIWGDFLATNKHVVQGGTRAKFFLIRAVEGQPRLGDALTVQLDGLPDWCFGHPDPRVDIAIMPLLPLYQQLAQKGQEAYVQPILTTSVPSKAQAEELSAIEEVVFVGYPLGIYDTRNYLPVVRRGMTATPVWVDYQGLPQFLIDASVFPGSSGSPVLVCNVGSYFDRQGLHVGYNRVLFLGVLAEVFFRRTDGTVRSGEIPCRPSEDEAREMADLGVVFKASTVVETIEALLRGRGEIR